MNLFTYKAIYCLFPKLTFEEKISYTSLDTPDLITSPSESRLDSYIQDGWTIKHRRINRSPSNSFDVAVDDREYTRTVGDDKTWVFPISGRWEPPVRFPTIYSSIYYNIDPLYASSFQVKGSQLAFSTVLLRGNSMNNTFAICVKFAEKTKLLLRIIDHLEETGYKLDYHSYVQSSTE